MLFRLFLFSIVGVTLLTIPYIGHADLVEEPKEPISIEDIQDLVLVAPNALPAHSPLSISYEIGYSERFFANSTYSPEVRDELFNSMLEDTVSYLEVWSGAPFTPTATLVESQPVTQAHTGTTTFSSLEPGTYFLVFVVSQEIRDRDTYCIKYAVPIEDCHQPGYFIEFPISETRKYFALPLASEEQMLYEAKPSAFGLVSFEVSETQGASNVLFLPGIKGSRLYDSTGTKVWEPFGNHDIESLFLNERGESIRGDIRTQPGDIIDSVALTTDIYGSFIRFMDGLVAGNTIQAWRAVPYDWRLSLPTIVNGTQPNIRDTLIALAETSKTGKVTIVAHSNGGLVAKALLQSLGDTESKRLVDNIIFVGVPQSGAPQALLALLYGYKEGLPWWFPGIVSVETARLFAQNAPMGYHLLPSKQYFEENTTHPLVSFLDTGSHALERTAYGTSIDSFNELAQFGRADNQERSKPHPGDIWSASILNTLLLSYTENIHASLDAWTPPVGIAVHQLAGWGVATVDGIEYYDLCVLDTCIPSYRPTFTHEGDGVVPTVSALMLKQINNTHHYWINLEKRNDASLTDKDHGTLLSLSEVHAVIKDILDGKTETLPPYIETSKPTQQQRKMFAFFLHSPLSIEVCAAEDACVSEDTTTLRGARYGRLGEMQYVMVPADQPYSVTLDGYGTGIFSLEIHELEEDAVRNTKTFVAIPVTPDTVATLHISSGIASIQTLSLDTNGDGITDSEIDSVETRTRFKSLSNRNNVVFKTGVIPLIETVATAAQEIVDLPTTFFREAEVFSLAATHSDYKKIEQLSPILETPNFIQRFLMILERILLTLRSFLYL